MLLYFCLIQICLYTPFLHNSEKNENFLLFGLLGGNSLCWGFLFLHYLGCSIVFLNFRLPFLLGTRRGRMKNYSGKVIRHNMMQLRLILDKTIDMRVWRLGQKVNRQLSFDSIFDKLRLHITLIHVLFFFLSFTLPLSCCLLGTRRGRGRGRLKNYLGKVIRLNRMQLQLMKDKTIDMRVWRLQIRLEGWQVSRQLSFDSFFDEFRLFRSL